MIRHRSILYIGGYLRLRQALGEAAVAENYRGVSAAHRQNALLEFGTDQIDKERIHGMRNPINLPVLILNPKRNLTIPRTTAASLEFATPRSWTTALPL